MKRFYIIGAVLLLPLLGSCLKTVWPETVGPFKVVKTERSPDIGYMVFTDGETFVNQDAWLFFKFNSSDVYGRIQAGESCFFWVNGIRLPILSWYRNILSVNCSPT